MLKPPPEKVVKIASPRHRSLTVLSDSNRRLRELLTQQEGIVEQDMSSVRLMFESKGTTAIEPFHDQEMTYKSRRLPSPRVKYARPQPPPLTSALLEIRQLLFPSTFDERFNARVGMSVADERVSSATVQQSLDEAIAATHRTDSLSASAYRTYRLKYLQPEETQSTLPAADAQDVRPRRLRPFTTRSYRTRSAAPSLFHACVASETALKAIESDTQKDKVSDAPRSCKSARAELVHPQLLEQEMLRRREHAHNFQRRPIAKEVSFHL